MKQETRVVIAATGGCACGGCSVYLSVRRSIFSVSLFYRIVALNSTCTVAVVVSVVVVAVAASRSATLDIGKRRRLLGRGRWWRCADAAVAADARRWRQQIERCK